jgi:hypothetical protein
MSLFTKDRATLLAGILILVAIGTTAVMTFLVDDADIYIGTRVIIASICCLCLFQAAFIIQRCISDKKQECTAMEKSYSVAFIISYLVFASVMIFQNMDIGIPKFEGWHALSVLLIAQGIGNLICKRNKHTNSEKTD